MISSVSALLVECFLEAVSKSLSTPSVTRCAYLSTFEIIGTIVKDAQCRRWFEIRARRLGRLGPLGICWRPRPLATFSANSSSTFRRWDTIRPRIVGVFDLAQLEGKGVDYMILLNRSLADIELARLTVVVGE